MITNMILADTKDKLILVAIIFAIIFFIALIGYIGTIIVRVMRWQGKRLDTLVGDAVYTRVIENKKHFIKYAKKKNWRYFFKKACIPLCIMIIGTMVLLIRDAVCHDFSYNVFDYEKTGFGTLFFIWDFADTDYYIVKLFNWFPVMKCWPKLISSPHWSNEAWASYIFMTCMIVGGGWYLIVLQCTLSRSIRIYKKADSMYSHNLDNFNVYESQNPFNNQNNNGTKQ